jgi:hypothetical protein
MEYTRLIQAQLRQRELVAEARIARLAIARRPFHMRSWAGRNGRGWAFLPRWTDGAANGRPATIER